MADTVVPPPVEIDPQSKLRWYQGVPRYAWIVFLIATLGWLFDAMDQNLYNLVRQPSITELVTKTGLVGNALEDAIKATSGNVTPSF